jgi:hypothetical protein
MSETSSATNKQLKEEKERAEMYKKLYEDEKRKTAMLSELNAALNKLIQKWIYEAG